MKSATKPHYFLMLFLLCISNMLTAQWYPPHEDPKNEPDPEPVDTIYQYWIKFPADVRTQCVQDVAIPGLEYDELGCDLLATGYSDDRFEVRFDSSCYKIFRTYRIINWCEYDGEAAPVRVSRDWDSWNGTNPGRCDQPVPDGNNKPGDSDFYVYVKRHLNDNKPDTVWYDADNDPHNNHPDNPATKNVEESYWWRVISGGNDRFLESYYEGGCSTWSYDQNQTDSDIAGNVFQDDDDFRYGSFGYWYYTQHIIVYDNIAPAIEIENPDTFYSVSNVDCAAEVAITIVPTDSCSESTPRVKVYLDVNNDGSIDEEVTNQLDDETFTGRYPIGQHRIEVEAIDNCGNTSIASSIFNIVDGLAPSPICHDGLVVELMAVEVDTLSPGVAEVWASDFVASPIYDCSGQDFEDLDANANPLVNVYSINRFGVVPSPSLQSLTLTCDDLDTGLVHIELHAWDALGNHDFCTSFINVQDQSLACLPNAVEGTVATANQIPISGVEIQFSGDMEGMILSDEKGGYEIPMGADLTSLEIKPSKSGGYMKGISTLDLIKMQKHILGMEPFDSPYSLIAADLDNNGKINLFDLIRMRKMLIGLETEMKNNQIWRFIPAGFQFNDPNNPWNDTFPESLHFETLDKAAPMNGSFIAMKIGDVNHSVDAEELEARSGQKLRLSYPELTLRSGESYLVPLQVSDFDQLEGLQLSLNWDKNLVEVVAVMSPFVAQESMHFNSKESFLNIAWARSSLDQTSEHFIRLEIKAKSNVALSQSLSLSSRLMKAEAYTIDKEIVGLQLKAKEKTSLDWEIGPNPFQEETLVRFNQATSGLLEVYDLQGRIVFRTTLLNESNKRLQKSDIGSPGLYILRLSRNGASDLVKEIVLTN